jgi:hypothetical protein
VHQGPRVLLSVNYAVGDVIEDGTSLAVMDDVCRRSCVEIHDEDRSGSLASHAQHRFFVSSYEF